MVGSLADPTNENYKVSYQPTWQRTSFGYILPRKSSCSGALLVRNRLSRSFPWAFSASLLFLLAASFGFLMRFSSSEFDANSSDSYSSTTYQPSLRLSTILISFCRRWIDAFALSTKVVIRGFLLPGSFSREISLRIPSMVAFISYCF